LRDFTVLIRRRSGGAVVVTIDSFAVVDASGDTTHVILRYADALKTKMTDQACARLAAIIESSEDGIVGNDLNGVVTSWHRGAEKMFGYTDAEMIGTSIRRLLPVHLEVEGQ